VFHNAIKQSSFVFNICVMFPLNLCSYRSYVTVSVGVSDYI